MSVLIKNMTMPECCAMCPMCHRNFDWRKPRLACYALSAWCIEDEDRLENCPLVELPEKHGDLIDRDDLKKEYAMGFDCNNCVSNQKSCEHDAFYAKMDFCLMLDDASVVIKAEGE